MDKYRFFDDITSDVVFEAYGATLKDVFINAAEAMFSVMCKMDSIAPRDERRIDVDADSVEDLMVNWLQSLIASVDIEEMFFSKFTITEIDETHLTAFVYGQSVSPELGQTVVKAVTYHQFDFRKTEQGYLCRVSLDI